MSAASVRRASGTSSTRSSAPKRATTPGVSRAPVRRGARAVLAGVFRLADTMETTAPPRRHSLPPVPPATAGTGQAAPVGMPQRRGLPKAQADAGQRFVARLRAAAPAFARAAGAESAMVPEAVPPARHRRSRCRVVLRRADGHQVDVTFLGPAAGPRGHLPAAFDEQIQEWLRAGQPRDHTWLVVDPDAAGGVAVDLTAWAARD